MAPSFGWHLGDDYTQLGSARAAVEFSDPRTRIAHIDTGYDRTHVAKPDHIVLEHSFVEGDPDPNKAEARATINLLPQNLDHGTGTIGILAGSRVSFSNDFLGGAPEAELVTLRIADSVILFKVWRQASLPADVFSDRQAGTPVATPQKKPRAQKQGAGLEISRPHPAAG